jgi:DNA-binding transcriptional regulator YdaS (Cro superfamily)
MKISTYLDRRGRGAAAEFARQLGVNASTVCDWKRGHRRPRLEMVLLINKITGGAVGPFDWIRGKLAG